MPLLHTSLFQNNCTIGFYCSSRILRKATSVEDTYRLLYRMSNTNGNIFTHISVIRVAALKTNGPVSWEQTISRKLYNIKSITYIALTEKFTGRIQWY